MTKKTIVLGLFLFVSMSARAIEIVTISAAVALAKFGWGVSKSTYYYFWPSQDELDQSEVNTHEAAVFEAEQRLYACLMRHQGSEKGEHRFPYECKAQKKNCKRVAGLLKYEQMRRVFRKFNQDLPK
jgi:hypothetical protein